MSRQRIAIMCNGVVPDSNIPCGAQGLRARGTQLGLQAHGYDVDIITKSNVPHVQAKRWGVSNIRVPGYWRLIQPENFVRTVNRCYDVLILPNWAALPDFVPRKDTKLIYDFFSATLVEHSFITDEEGLNKRRESKIELLSNASNFIGNGIGRAEYGTKFLNEVGLGNHDVASVRLTAQGLPRSVDKAGGFRIFAGGFDQPWTQGLTPEVLFEVADSVRAEIVTIGVGKNPNMDKAPLAFDSLSQNRQGIGRVLGHPPQVSKGYNTLNASSHVTLDVFMRNAEREVSYSTRAVSALSNGCPLITMSFTEIGQIVKELDCGWVLDEFSIEALIDLLREIESDRDEVERRAANILLFRERYGDPVTEAQGLVDFLT